jgi:hypothetical protein
MDQMRRIREDILRPFVDPVSKPAFDGLLDGTSIARHLDKIEDDLKSHLTDTMEDMTRTFSSTHFSKDMFSILMGSNLAVALRVLSVLYAIRPTQTSILRHWGM